jgi:hypothetical protein
MTVASETICTVRPGGGFDLDRYVYRTFRTPDAAHRWSARQTRPVTLVVVARRVKVGDRVHPSARGLWRDGTDPTAARRIVKGALT